MTKQNCWEFKSCGREPGGYRAADLGTCPASVDESMDGLNGGCNAGRICWAVSGYLSEAGQMLCASGKKLATCTSCDFFKLVLQEESIHGLALLKPGAPAGGDQQTPDGRTTEKANRVLEKASTSRD